MNAIITQERIKKTVTIRNGQEVVRSDKLAEMFERTHKQVLALIREKAQFFQANSISLKDYFIEDYATTSKGKEYSRYYLTRKGFDYIAMSLRGQKAELYKLWYIDAFHDKQQVIEEHKLTSRLNHSDDLWLQFRQEGKVFRNKLTQAIQETVVEYRNTRESKMNDGKYFYHYTVLIYSKLGITLPKGVNPRDVLDKRMLVRLEDMEDRVADSIDTYAATGMHYKDVFKQIKTDLSK